MLARSAMDIELLVRWAYRDELIKRQISSADGIWDRITLGLGRDSGQHTATAAQRYPHFGEPHPDAERIERAIVELPNVAIDWPNRGRAIMGDLFGLLD